MRRGAVSLRLRLFVLIMVPVVLVALALGAWRVSAARATSHELFDRSLLSAALAISRDVAVSGGDALLPSTRRLIEDATGGEVFYHVTGPGGIYVTGYAYPPVPNERADPEHAVPAFSLSVYRGDAVRVLQITEVLTIDTLTGATVITVWQRLSDRSAFTRALVLRAAVMIGGLIASLALALWLAVRRGLRPLLELEHAIALRSPDDLRPVQRQVPEETTGIVTTFNRLLSQIQTSMASHQVFISDAAHQLRNPAAAVLSLAEAARDAPSDAERRSRLDDVVHAARQSNRTAEQLLSLDRLRQTHQPLHKELRDLRDIVTEVSAEQAVALIARGVEFELDAAPEPLELPCDPVLVGEAVKNLIDNAAKHGGPHLRKIVVCCGLREEGPHVDVLDDGVGIPLQDRARVLERFSQLQAGPGSGLGLAIVESVMTRHGGTISFVDGVTLNGLRLQFVRQ